MEVKDITQSEFSTVEDYVNAIVANADDNAVVQALVLRAAKDGILPFLWGVDSNFVAFSQIDPDVAKVFIAESMFFAERGLLGEEEEKQKMIAGRQAIESFLDLEDTKTQLLKDLEKSLIALEANQAHYRERQRRILLQAKKLNLLPSEEHVDRCQPHKNDIHPCEGMSIEAAISKHKEGIKALIRSFDTPDNDVDETGLRHNLILDNRRRFLKALRYAVCQISLKGSEEERQFLLQNLQKARLYKVVTAIGIKNDDDEDADGNRLKDYNYEVINKDFRAANLAKAQFRASGLDGALFQGATLEEANFRCAILTNANFTDANLKGANLGSTTLKGAIFDGANLQGANLKNIGSADEEITFQLDALLKARSLVGILIEQSTLKEYTREEQKRLRDKLVTDYQSFFQSSEDINEIIETVYLISPHTSLPESSTLMDLNAFLGEDRAAIYPLLKIAHTRVEKLIQQGERISQKNIKRLEARYTSFSDLKQRTIFGHESCSPSTDPLLIALLKNYSYYEFLDKVDEAYKQCKAIDSIDKYDEEVRNQLAPVFDFVVRFWKESSPHAEKAFSVFNKLLLDLYGTSNDEKHFQTLIYFFLKLLNESELCNWPHKAFLSFMDTLFSLDTKWVFASSQDKWALILALLNGLSGEAVESFKNTALINLIDPSSTYESPKKILGVGAILSCQELALKIDHLIGLLRDLSNATVINENSEQDTKANNILEEVEALFHEIFKQKTAVYEQIIMNPVNVKLVDNMPNAEEPLEYLASFQAKKTKLFALIKELDKTDGDTTALYTKTSRLANLKTDCQRRIALFVVKLIGIKKELQTYRDSWTEKQALLLKVLANFVNREPVSTELPAKAILETEKAQTLQIPLGNFSENQEEHPVPVNLPKPPASAETSITLPIETLFESEDQEKGKPLLTDMLTGNAAVENENVSSSLKRNLELKNLMTGENDLPHILYQWYLFRQKNNNALTEDEQAKLSIYVQIRSARGLMGNQTVYTEAVGEILSVLEAYVEALNQLQSGNEQFLLFKRRVLEILISLDILLYWLEQLAIKSAAGADLDNLLESINDECEDLNHAIKTVETLSQSLLDNVPSLIKKLDSQVKIAQGYELNAEQFDRLAHRLSQAQYSLYAAVSLCVVSTIIVAALVATPYFAIPIGIALLALVASEVVRREKNVAEEKKQVNKTALNNMPSTLSDYTSRYFSTRTQLFFNQQKDSSPQQKTLEDKPKPK